MGRRARPFLLARLPVGFLPTWLALVVSKTQSESIGYIDRSRQLQRARASAESSGMERREYSVLVSPTRPCTTLRCTRTVWFSQSKSPIDPRCKELACGTVIWHGLQTQSVTHLSPSLCRRRHSPA